MHKNPGEKRHCTSLPNGKIILKRHAYVLTSALNELKHLGSCSQMTSSSNCPIAGSTNLHGDSPMWHKWSSNHPPYPLMSLGIGADLISVVVSYIR